MVQWHYLAPSILFPLCRKGDTENTYLRRLFEVWVMNMTLHRVRLTSFDHSIKILGWPKLIWVFSVMLYAKSLQLWPTQPPDGLVTLQAPLSMGFSRQEYWRGLSCPPSGELPDPKIKLKSLMPPALKGRFFTTSATYKYLTKKKKKKIQADFLAIPILFGSGAQIKLAHWVCNIIERTEFHILKPRTVVCRSPLFMLL